MTTIVDCVQGTEPWAEARRGLATASRFKDILTPKTMKLSASARGYICELIAEEMTPPHYWIKDDYMSKAMVNGVLREDEGCNFFELETSQDAYKAGFIVSDCGRFGCSPDRLVDPDAGLELKCPLHKTQIAWLLDGVTPAEYMPQVHGSMLVTKRPRWYFLSYAPGLPPLLVEERVNEYTEKLAAALEEFWTLYTELRNKIQGAGDPVAAIRKPFISPF